MDSEDTKSVICQLEFGRPKFQATIPERARRVLDVTEDDLDEDERAIVQAELELQEIYTKD
jgi:hypothetical protein